MESDLRKLHQKRINVWKIKTVAVTANKKQLFQKNKAACIDLCLDGMFSNKIKASPKVFHLLTVHAQGNEQDGHSTNTFWSTASLTNAFSALVACSGSSVGD